VTAIAPLPIETELIRSFLQSPQEAKLSIRSRRFTGVGLYTEFSVTSALRDLMADEQPAGPMNGPTIESPEIPNGAGSLLWVNQSGVHTLEIFSYTDPFPETLVAFSLRRP